MLTLLKIIFAMNFHLFLYPLPCFKNLNYNFNIMASKDGSMGFFAQPLQKVHLRANLFQAKSFWTSLSKSITSNPFVNS